MKRLVVLLVLVFFIYLPAHACTCGRSSQPIAKQIAEAKAENRVIFHGRVIAASQELTVLTVDKAWTPNISQIMFVSSGQSNCGYPFDAGKDYTIIAYSYGGKIRVSVCGLTRRGLPEEYQRALGLGYRPVNYAALWWGFGGLLWLATFVFLRIRRRKLGR